MAVYGWDVTPVRPIVAAGATASGAFSVPLSIGTMTILVGALDSGATWKLQGLVPTGQDTETWYDSYFLGQNGVPVQLASLGTSQAITFSNMMIPGGVIRIVTSTAQATAKTFTVLFSQFQR